MDENLLNKFNELIKNVNTYEDLLKIKITYIGKNGIINEYFRNIKNLDITKETQKIKFQQINKIKQEIENKIHTSKVNFFKNIKEKSLDITLPGLGTKIGREHIINKSINEIKDFFIQLGFKINNGYEIDTTYYNFDALNIDTNHPSRNPQDTFYISKKKLLRTHTSNMQIHTMENEKPPLKIISYGKVYRRDSDASHTPMFHQIEGFVIDKNISIAKLKYLLINFLKYFFNKENIKINIRTSYFPFTEPSMEIDIECISCFGKKCNLCKKTGWIEVLGCGLIHPNILKKCKIKKGFNGLAFGMGIERLSMIKYGINDIRLYFENNTDFLRQF